MTWTRPDTRFKGKPEKRALDRVSAPWRRLPVKAMAIPAEVVAKIRATPFEKLEKGWAWAVIRYGNAELAKADRFYLLCVLLHRKDAFRP